MVGSACAKFDVTFENNKPKTVCTKGKVSPPFPIPSQSMDFGCMNLNLKK